MKLPAWEIRGHGRLFANFANVFEIVLSVLQKRSQIFDMDTAHTVPFVHRARARNLHILIRRAHASA
eukprot:5324480-Pleurochrysis_carterae.AAC.1